MNMKTNRKNNKAKYLILFLSMMICLVLAEIGIFTIGRKKTGSKEAERANTAASESGITAEGISESSGSDTPSEEQASSGENSGDEKRAEAESGTEEIPETEAETGVETEGATEIKEDARIEDCIRKLTLEEKVAQLFLVTPDSFMEFYGFNVAGPATQETFNEYPISGLIMMGHNLDNVPQIQNMNANLQSFSLERIGLPMFIATDEEGGTVARVAGNGNLRVSNVGNMWDIGETGDAQKAYEAGSYVGGYLRDYGFNLDFAPVADVLSNPDNQVIGVRSFGSDPALVSSMCRAFSRGLMEQGVISCYKHFPGHGATAGDSHKGYAYTDKSLEEMEACELIPFADAVKDDAKMIMVGHISLPYVIGETVPASLSYDVISGLLRRDLGYDGVVITDALNMGAITAEYSSAEACVATIQAGADILLEPYNFRDGYNGVLEAVKDGTIPEERIDESLRRILKLKYEILDQMEVE